MRPGIATAIKLGFKKRQFIYSSVVLFSVMYALSPPSLILRLALLVAIGISAEITFTMFATGLVSAPLKLYFSGKKLEQTEIPEIIEVAAELGVKLPKNPFRLTDEDVPAATNAYTNRMIFNKAFLEELTPDERRFVGGHEVTHITDGMRSLLTLISYLMVVVPVASYSLAYIGLPTSLIPLPAFAAMIMVMYYTQRRAELRADLGGAKFVKYDVAESAIRKVYREHGMDAASDTHPSGNTRLRNLRNYYRRKRLVEGKEPTKADSRQEAEDLEPTNVESNPI